MARSDKTSLFHRKLAELDQEAQRVESTIKDLSRTLRKIESGEIAPAPVTSRSAPRFQRTTVSPASAKAQEALERAFAGSRSPPSSLLEPTPEDTEPPAPDRTEPGMLPGLRIPADSRKPPAPTPGKFASYLSTGSFGKAGRPLSQEKRVMRNKAIFMLMFALIALYILLRTVF